MNASRTFGLKIIFNFKNVRLPVIKAIILGWFSTITFQVICQDTTFIPYDYPSNYILKNNRLNLSFKNKVSLLLTSTVDSCNRLFVFNGKSFKLICPDICFSDNSYQVPINDTLAVIVDSAGCILLNYNTGITNKLHIEEMIHRGHVYCTVGIFGRSWIIGTRDLPVHNISSFTSADMLKQNIFMLTNRTGNYFHFISLDSNDIDGFAFILISNYIGNMTSSFQQIDDTAILIILDTLMSFVNVKKYVIEHSTPRFECSYDYFPFKLKSTSLSKLFGDILYIFDPSSPEINKIDVSNYNCHHISSKNNLLYTKMGIKSMHVWGMNTFFFYRSHMEACSCRL
jgi:hypothetical protein